MHWGLQKRMHFLASTAKVMGTIYLGQGYWEFTIEPDETLTFIYEKDTETIFYEEGLPFECAASRITNIALRNNLLNV